MYSDKRTEILFPGAGQSLTNDGQDVKVTREIPGIYTKYAAFIIDHYHHSSLLPSSSPTSS